MLPVAIQLYSVRDEAEANLGQTLQNLKAMGYDGVEFAGLYGNRPGRVRKLCEKVGLVPVSAHLAYYDMLADPDGLFRDYAEIGCRFAAIAYLTPECRPGTAGFAKVVENTAFLGKAAAKRGIQLLYHNHDFEFERIDGRYALDVLYDSIPADLLQTELDLCWVRVGGEDPAAYLLKYAGRAPVVHLKDYVGGKSAHMYDLIGQAPQGKDRDRETPFEYRPLGSGVQDIPSLLDAAGKAGTEWLVVEQDEPSMGLSSLQCAEQSILYLKSL